MGEGGRVVGRGRRGGVKPKYSEGVRRRAVGALVVVNVEVWFGRPLGWLETLSEEERRLALAFYIVAQGELVP